MARLRSVCVLVGAVLSGNALLLAQAKFDNGQVRFNVPKGWHTETNPKRPMDVQVKADQGVAFILIAFHRELPSDLQKLGIAMQPEAISEVSGFFTSKMEFRVVQGCAELQRGSFSGSDAIECSTAVQDAQGFPALIRSIGVSLPGTVCLLSEFSSRYAGDVNALQAADSVVEESLQFGPSSNGDPVLSPEVQSGSNIYRNSQRRVTFSPPSDWRLVHAEDNLFAYRSGESTFAVYFGGFSDLFYIVGGAKSPWNIHIDSRDHFTATAGSYYMEASGKGQFTTLVISPVSGLTNSLGTYRTMDSYLKWDPQPVTRSVPGSVVTSQAPADTGGCPGCAQAIMDHMSAMTSITGSGW